MENQDGSSLLTAARVLAAMTGIVIGLAAVSMLCSGVFMIASNDQLQVALVDGAALIAMSVAGAITRWFVFTGHDPVRRRRAESGCLSYIVGGILGVVAAQVLGTLAYPRGSEMFSVIVFIAGFLGSALSGIFGMLKGNLRAAKNQL